MKRTVFAGVAIFSALLCLLGCYLGWWLIDHPDTFTKMSDGGKVRSILFIAILSLGGALGALKNWKASVDAC